MFEALTANCQACGQKVQFYRYPKLVSVSCNYCKHQLNPLHAGTHEHFFGQLPRQHPFNKGNVGIGSSGSHH